MIPVRIGTVNDKVQTQMVLDILKQQGITAYSEAISVTSYRDPYRGYGTGGEAIFVDKNDVKDAKELVGDFFTENATDIEEKRTLPAVRIVAIIILAVWVIVGIYSLVSSMI